MFERLKSIFRGGDLLDQALDETLEMMREDLDMFRIAVKCLWSAGEVPLDEIRARDRDINRNVRDVRKKVLAHLAFSGSSHLNTALILVSVVRDIERIGDMTKDIAYLATDFPGKMKAGKLEDDLKKMQNLVEERLALVIGIFEQDQIEKARQITGTHKEVDKLYLSVLTRLINDDENALTHGQTAVLALYLRYLRRIEGHLFNIASAEVNPFHRMDFKEKKKTAKP